MSLSTSSSQSNDTERCGAACGGSASTRTTQVITNSENGKDGDTARRPLAATAAAGLLAAFHPIRRRNAGIPTRQQQRERISGAAAPMTTAKSRCKLQLRLTGSDSQAFA